MEVTVSHTAISGPYDDVACKECTAEVNDPWSVSYDYHEQQVNSPVYVEYAFCALLPSSVWS